jgi:hypothetical protein
VARALCDPAPLVVIDEFTSVVDRTVAQIGSAAVAKAVRRTPGKQVVCVTCHYDVEEWLCPDWVVEMPTGNFARRSLQRPPIELEVARVHSSAWAPIQAASLYECRTSQVRVLLLRVRPASARGLLLGPPLPPPDPPWLEGASDGGPARLPGGRDWGTC